MIKELTTENFDNELQNGLKLVEFYATWCGYCKKQAPILEEMDKVWVGKLNVDESAEIAIRYGINSFPSFILFKDGVEVTRFSGLKTKYDLMEIVTKFL